MHRNSTATRHTTENLKVLISEDEDEVMVAVISVIVKAVRWVADTKWYDGSGECGG